MDASIKTLSDVEVSYGQVKDDRSLPEDFHEQGRQVVHLHQFLKTMKTTLEEHSLAEDTIGTTMELNRDATLLRHFFQGVAETHAGSRSAYYHKAQGNVGHGRSVRVVLIQVMNVACTLAEKNAIGPTIEQDIKRLRGGIDKLENADSNRSMNHFHGQGQNNLVSGGT
ncbi:hypothetical protein NM208_g3854 [Fusarium decemcellulare]|uniref:Uncharacterized protein n=1 Tax=Fusarium decemcellulare TaxID=57161 RepID=A0ACC1SMK3_9HYPO|nr:hypothetical protein NM208_g3854 [Fusarium decemcellulare]